MTAKHKKANATGLYLEGIRDGQPETAVAKYTGHRYTQHSTGIASGHAGFIAFFNEFIQRNPEREVRLVRILCDANLVFIHAFQSLNQGTAQWVTMDIFDTREDDKVIEHWDVIGAYVTTPTGQDMLSGPTEVGDIVATESNKRQVKEFIKQVLTEGKADLHADFIASDFVDHSSFLPAAEDAWKGFLVQGGRYEFIHQLLGEGQFVATSCKVNFDGQDYAVMDLFRLDAQQIVEHWACHEPIVPKDQWGNSGKF